MDLKEIEEHMKFFVAHYRAAARDLLNKGYYLRGRNCSPIEGSPLHCDLYVLDKDSDEINFLCYNTTKHRARVVVKAWLDGTINQVDPEILQNYINNGYNTRRGLFAKYSDSTKDRVNNIARSHADLLGCETGSSREDHYRRVAMRR